MDIRANVETLKRQIPSGVTLLAATKTRSPEEIGHAIAAGMTAIGENYVQEAEKKFPLIRNKVEKHLIGPLQKSKINRALKLFDVIQTVDTYELAEAISGRADRLIRILIQINIGEEPQKSGCLPGQAPGLLTRIKSLQNLRVEGLMTMPPYHEDPERSRPYFREMKRLFDTTNKEIMEKKMTTLSMGLSHDYKVAIEEGSTMVRLGTVIFGERQK